MSLESRWDLSSEIGTSLTGGESVLPWLGKAVVPHLFSYIELMVRSLLVVVGFMTFCTSLELLLHKGESRSQVLMQLFPGTAEWYRR